MAPALHHLIALRFAGLGTDSGWRFAQAYEAAALGYLVDAMNAGALLTPRVRGPFGHLSENREEAEDYFANAGVYVLKREGKTHKKPLAAKGPYRNR